MAEIGGALRKGDALTVNSGNGRLLTFTSTDGHGDSIQVDGVLGSGKYGQYIYTNTAQTTSSLQRVENANAGTTQPLVMWNNAGTANIILAVAQSVTSSTINFLVNGNTSSSAGMMLLDNDVDGDSTRRFILGAKESAGSGTFQFSRNVALANTAGPVMRFLNENSGDDQDVVEAVNAGTGQVFNINQTGVLAAGKEAVQISSATAQVNAEMLLVSLTNASSTYALSTFNNDGSGTNIVLNKQNSGIVQSIVQTVNNASPCYGINFNLANAGAGLEYAFRFDGSEIVAGAVGGAQDAKIRVSRAGVDYYIALNTA